MASNTPRPTKAERRAAARAKAQALREEQERRERRLKITRRALLGGGVVAAVGGTAALVVVSRRDAGRQTVDELADTAKKAGVSRDVVKAFEKAVKDNSYGKWTEAGTNAFKDKKLSATPTVFLADTQLNLQAIATATALTEAVAKLPAATATPTEAASGAPTGAATETPAEGGAEGGAGAPAEGGAGAPAAPSPEPAE